MMWGLLVFLAVPITGLALGGFPPALFLGRPRRGHWGDACPKGVWRGSNGGAQTDTSPEPTDVNLFGKRASADATELRISR